ncbi:MAG: ATP-binding cassette domain-containing protein [Candidatus Methylacidiphilales bacterium]|nr:ATP-binding cassette domain-containing protein [Candidatus Methylacidiphilales bacterium]
MANPLLHIQNLTYRYGERVALREFSLGVNAGEIFGFLGPNGGGKTTLFKLLTTLRAPQEGEIHLGDDSYRGPLDAIRARIGCVFQHPALDKKLKVAENLRHQGHLYGLGGGELESRIDALLARFGLTERKQSFVQDLSGGLQRRVEIAKALLHRPQILLMDEPSTGLDPGIRMELWEYYEQMRREDGLTLLMTTHLLEEAERCDRIVLLDEGRIIAEGAPQALRESLSGRILRLSGGNLQELAVRVKSLTTHTVEVQAREVVVRLPTGAEDEAARIIREIGAAAESVNLARPTLADVYQAKVGRTWAGKEKS